jgi:DNA-directed RNA polymerase specialized sigma subunit
MCTLKYAEGEKQKIMSEQTIMNTINTEQAAKDFTPLIKATAHRYAGRGAEYDDLVQEGYLALLRLVPH